MRLKGRPQCNWSAVDSIATAEISNGRKEATYGATHFDKRVGTAAAVTASEMGNRRRKRVAGYYRMTIMVN
jgi:hypothetical protein